jgi:hypothetical protein
MRPPARYIGGPLAGLTQDGTPRSIYRDDDGQPIPAVKGYREWAWFRKEPQRYYARQVWRGRVYYIHATAWRNWQDDRLGRAALIKQVTR